MGADRAVYLDSSAIVKLVVSETESVVLRRYVRRQRKVVSSALARTEVVRAALPLGASVLRRARAVLRAIDLVRVNDQVLASAGMLEPVELRTLDAIHLATAGLLANSLARFVCYDLRLARAAGLHGWSVHAPG